jgi:putative transcriptional regulator
MSRKAFEKIREGLAEAIAVAKGRVRPHKMHVPVEIDVKALRKRIGLTQKTFASVFGFTLTQIRDWEQERSRPLDASRAYLLLIDADPVLIQAMIGRVQQSRRKLGTADVPRKRGGIDFEKLTRSRESLGFYEDGPEWTPALDDPKLTREVLGLKKQKKRSFRGK